MTLFFHLKPSTEKQFREMAMKKYGFGKGSLKSALEDAIGDWLQKQGASPDVKENAKPDPANGKNETRQK